MAPILFGLVLIVIAIGLLFLAFKSLRIKQLPVRVLAALLSGIIGVLALFIAGVDFKGIYTLNETHNLPVTTFTASTDPATIARGQVFAHLCASCHSSTGDIPLDGANDDLLGAGNPIAVLYPPNLTPGGPLKNWSDGQIERAVREGVDNNGHVLIIMPSELFHNLSDSDAQAVVAYLRSQPAVAHATPPRTMGVLGMLLTGAGVFPTSVQPAITQPVVAPPAGPNMAYGGYLVSVSGCTSCHGTGLTGGKALPGGGGPPIGPNLTQIVPKWTEAQFLSTIRTGVDPTGHQLSTEMPWKNFSTMYSDDDLSAIYAYIHALTPQPNTP